MKNVTASYELITPELAKEWLAANTDNRKLRPKRVAALVKKIQAGKWQKTHQGIAFGSDGLLYDGQHRLHAIAQAGIAVEVLVVRGLDRDSRSSIDEVLVRRASENHNLAASNDQGYKLSYHEGQVLRILWVQDSAVKNFTSWSACGANFSAADLSVTVEKHRDGFNAIMRGSLRLKGHNNPLSRAGVVAAFIYAYPVIGDNVVNAYQDMLGGTGLVESNPLWLLRESLLQSRKHGRVGGASQVNDFDLTLTALKAWQENKTMKALRVVQSSCYAFEHYHADHDTDIAA